MSDQFVVAENHNYVVPTRAIISMGDMTKWKNCEAFHEYKGFILAVNDAVKGKPLSSQYSESPAVEIILNLLKELLDWVDRFPPLDQPQRFGNQAFRQFYNHLKQEQEMAAETESDVKKAVNSLGAGSIKDWHFESLKKQPEQVLLPNHCLRFFSHEEAEGVLKKYLPEKFHNAIPEISIYLVEGFGNSTRIDYGTGHEMAFLWFLCCLFKIGFFIRDDQCAVGLKVFDRYLHLVRKLQTTYRMEPAGSRGVWSLDDFQFVPFIWGSSQLMGNPQIETAGFYQPEIVNKFSNDFLLIGCIRYINEVKTGPFFEHSNQLYNLSGVDNWRKVNQGLIKMYENEVLNSFPVVQHILFGSLMSIAPAPRPAPSKGPQRLPRPVDPSQLPPPGV